MNGTWGTVIMNMTLAPTLMNHAAISRLHLSGSLLKSSLIQPKILFMVFIEKPECMMTIYRLVITEALAVL